MPALKVRAPRRASHMEYSVLFRNVKGETWINEGFVAGEFKKGDKVKIFRLPLRATLIKIKAKWT